MIHCLFSMFLKCVPKWGKFQTARLWLAAQEISFCNLKDSAATSLSNLRIGSSCDYVVPHYLDVSYQFWWQNHQMYSFSFHRKAKPITAHRKASKWNINKIILESLDHTVLICWDTGEHPIKNKGVFCTSTSFHNKENGGTMLNQRYPTLCLWARWYPPVIPFILTTLQKVDGATVRQG